MRFRLRNSVLPEKVLMLGLFRLVHGNSYTVKSHFKALGLYKFERGFGWAYKQGGLYPGGLISGIKKMFQNDEIKCI